MSSYHKLRNLGFGLAAAIPLSLAASQVQALPYAYASNVDTGFSIIASGGTYTANNGSFQTTNAIGGSLVNDSSSANGTGATISDAPQVYFGPAVSKPAENTFTQQLTGLSSPALRADSLDSGFAGSGANVAEANLTGAGAGTFGTGSGVLNSNNTSAITVNVDASGTVLRISFNDNVNLQTSTRPLADETASAAISSSVTIQRDGVTVFSFAPNGLNTGVAGGTSLSDPYSLNTNVASSGGGSLSSSYVHTGGTFTADTFALAAGTYTVLINQQSNIGLTVGTPTSTPEPASLALLGAGLIGLGAFRRNRKSS